MKKYCLLLLMLLVSCARQEGRHVVGKMQLDQAIPDWVVFPDKEWQRLTPEQAFPDEGPSHITGSMAVSNRDAWNAWVLAMNKKVRGAAWQGENHSDDSWGVAITWGGYLLQTFGDPEYRFQTASLGKAFTMACLQLALDEGRIASAEDVIKNYWTGEGQLNSSRKYLSKGHHTRLSFLHLALHTGGFPVTNGYTWQNCKNYERVAPSWANCTADPDFDNYAHAEPGTVEKSYSSGGYWRLAQALTVIWKKDLKKVMDEKLFSKMGIPPDRWDWIPGRTVREDARWYPHMPGYGLYIDPPYEIDGAVVRGGPGWVVMSAKDLARFGLLIATRGIWGQQRLISDTQLLRAHAGGNGSFVAGIGQQVMLSFGEVTSAGIDFLDIPVHLFMGRRPQPSSTNITSR
ncbi:MAG: serine hydrolase [Acidobacteria bacterium]|nr:serine hydrolase [Acidobacteriota bacterium]MCI0721548.1 serine hydrolase [Acidobacteriota bacterium]